MDRKQEDWAIPTLVKKEKSIDPKPQYQRGPVWSEKQKQLLIDSIIRGMDVPKIYLREVKDKKFKYEVVDGQQRLRAIWEYHRNEFSLPDDSDKVSGKDIAGKNYEDLPETLSDNLDTYQMSVVILTGEEEEIEEMFLRLQNGTTLKAAERRNAMNGPIRDFVREQVSHPFFTKVSFKNDRFAFDSAIAQVLQAEIMGGPTDVTDKELERTYKERKSFKGSSKEAKQVIKILNFLNQEFKEKNPLLRKQLILSIYLLATELDKYFAISGLKKGWFSAWFENFEEYKSSELEKSEDQMDPEINRYNLFSQQGTNRRDSLRIRLEVLLAKLLNKFPDLELKDPTRGFSEHQRGAVFIRDKKSCQKCRNLVAWEDASIDHIVPHSKGGKTSLSNAQLLCTTCNLVKGNR